MHPAGKSQRKTGCPKRKITRTGEGELGIALKLGSIRKEYLNEFKSCTLQKRPAQRAKSVNGPEEGGWVVAT